MDSTNLFVVNVISVSTLTIFIDRLITDGNYKTVRLVYDMGSVRDNNLIRDLSNNDKYNTFIVNSNSLTSIEPKSTESFGILQIILLDWDERWQKTMKHRSFATNYVEQFKTLNVVMFIRKPSDLQRELIWPNLAWLAMFYNVSVVFYDTVDSMDGHAPTNMSLEVFVLNFDTSKAVLPARIDVEQCFNLVECNLYEKIFESIPRKTRLFVPIDVDRSPRNRKLMKNAKLNATSIDFGSSAAYLTNFVVRNLRTKNVFIQQTLTCELLN